MLWIIEAEMVESVDDLKSSRSIRRIQIRDRQGQILVLRHGHVAHHFDLRMYRVENVLGFKRLVGSICGRFLFQPLDHVTDQTLDLHEKIVAVRDLVVHRRIRILAFG